MKTFTALVKATVNGVVRNTRAEIRAISPAEAKWLLQAVYGFHSVASFPQERREVLTSEDLSKPPTPEQQRLNALKSSKNRANDALKAERDRQKRQKALKDLQSLTTSNV
jgi:hypothetical protein